MRPIRSFLLIALFALPLFAHETLKIKSRELGETRDVIVHLPDSYAQSKTVAYPVMYVLDGGTNHRIADAASSFLGVYGTIPELIVVAIPNTNRMRDFSPDAGAAKFLRFLTTELVPRIDSRYRTRPMRILAGHSLTALFTVWAMTQMPDAFFGWIALDPSLWWNDGAVLKALNARKNPRGRFVMIRSGESQKRRGDFPFTNLILSDETHASLPYRGFYEALEILFADYKSQALTVGELEAHYEQLSREYGYRVPIPDMAWFELVYRSEEKENWDEAARALDRLAAQSPNNPEIADERAHLEEMRKGRG
jgi:predicted alpha/beta superfamily hydrolase